MSVIQYISVATTLFLLGMCGIVLNRKNILIMLMSVELMLLAVNLNYILFSGYMEDIYGQMYSLYILTVAAAESAIGLAILLVNYRVNESIAVEKIHKLRG